jgi:hypothetical protein
VREPRFGVDSLNVLADGDYQLTGELCADAEESNGAWRCPGDEWS